MNELLKQFLTISASNPTASLWHLFLLPTAFIALVRVLISTDVLRWLADIGLNLTSLFHQTPSSASICFAFLISLYAFYELHWKRRHLPPGPMPWLLAGNMPQVLLHGAHNIDALLQQWRAHYGGIFTFWMGPIPMVMVSEVELLRRYFVRNGDAFSGRWQNFITHTFMDGHNGVVQIQGEKWREQRRFSLHVLRDFGLGRALMEEKIRLEVKALITHLDSHFPVGSSKTDEGPVDICKPVAVCIANIINNILFGCTYAHDDPAFIRVQQMLDRQSSLVVQPVMGLYLCLPWTTKVPGLDRAWRELLGIRHDFWAFLEGHIQEHRKKFQEEDGGGMAGSDFTFAYMTEMQRRREAAAAGKGEEDMMEEEEGGENVGYFSEKQLKMLLLDLFFAGSETTVTTTKWGILLLILHPEVQEGCHREMMAKIGHREPELKDRSQLTYLSATICEIQRHANILPINLLRTCMDDVHMEEEGYHFPAGTMVLPQISITMNDPLYFPEPAKFLPERFIDERTGALLRVDAFLPFSIGKRQCLGESLARAELFFIFAYLCRGHTTSKTMPTGKGPQRPSTGTKENWVEEGELGVLGRKLLVIIEKYTICLKAFIRM